MAKPSLALNKHSTQLIKRRPTEMKRMKFKNMAMIGAMSIAGVGLVGVGAHATWTTSTASAQTVTAGNLSVAVSATGSTCLTLDTSGNCNSIQLLTAGPVGSTFDSGPTTVTETNEGSAT